VNVPLLGFTPKSDVRIDLDSLIASRLLIQANSGGGKSRAIRYLLEQTFGQVQHIVLDREGEFATLRDNFPYLLVGRDGDVAADPRTAKLLARKVMELGVSVVIDLSEMTLAHQREYLASFIGALNHLPRPLWHDCLIVIDEAHLFAPEAGKGASVATEAIAMLLSTGRKRGYCGVLATQRLAKLSKDVSAECLNKLIGRTSQEDLRRAADELGQRSADARELRALEPGHFWAYGPAIAADPILTVTGAVATAPPTRGATRAATAPAPNTIRDALAQLSDLPKQAADEARTLEGLTRENTELKQRITRLEKGGTARVIEKPIVDQVTIDRAVHAATTRVNRDLQKLVKLSDEMIGRANAVRQGLMIVLGDSEVVTPNTPTVSEVPSVTPRRTILPASDLTGPQQRVINALGAFASLGIDSVPKSNVAVFANYTENGTFNNILGTLRASGLIDYPSGGHAALTETGRGKVTEIVEIRSRHDLHAAWYRKLTGPQRRVLEVLVEMYPRAIDKADLAPRVGYTENGTYNNILGALRSLGVVEYPQKRVVAASSLLFPEALA
jgi:hypothetical protein